MLTNIKHGLVLSVCGVLAAGVVQSSLACTRVLLNQPGEHVMVGRNMDWMLPLPASFVIYPEGMQRSGMVAENAYRWTSHYASAVATSYDTITTDGFNEKGLATHLLALSESDYGVRDTRLPGLSVAMWAQFYLDNFASVKEAVDFTRANSFQMVGLYIPQVNKYVNLHMAIEDASGDSAIIEYINGQPVVSEGRDTTVLTNSPAYPLQLENLKQYAGFGGDKPLPGTTLPWDRFVRASYYSAHLPRPANDAEALTQVESILANAAQPAGTITPERPSDSQTRWHSVIDLTDHVYYFRSNNGGNLIHFSLDHFRLTAGAPVMRLKADENQELHGDVTDQFMTATR